MTVDESRKLDEVAGQVNAVLVTMARVETKLDTIVTGHGDHETRLRAIERRMWTLAGAAAAVGTGGGAVLARILGG